MLPLLEVRNLSTHFFNEGKIIRAVDDISFSLNSGECIGIVGESGSGKSVTALSLMRLVPAPGKIIRGEVMYATTQTSGQNPVDLLTLAPRKLYSYRGQELAMIFQEPITSLNPVFTCGNQVDEAIRLHLGLKRKEAKQMTLRLFESVRLSHPVRIYTSYPHQLSGGEKQRVMIAMAISCSPSLLIADEPTTALDVTVQVRILELMRELRVAYNMSMIFITHDLSVVSEIADRILVMYKGRIVEEGSVREIFSAPKHPYTKGLIACRPPVNKKLRRLPVISDFMMEEQEVMREVNQEIHAVVASNVISDATVKERLRSLQNKPVQLSVRNLSVWFPLWKGLFRKVSDYVKAVDNISFDVAEGETLGLVGESGSGKSTLGRAILQLVDSTAGEVLFEGKNLATMDKEELRKLRRQIQIIFQDPYSSLNPRLTIGYAIMEPMKVHKLYADDKERKEKAMELLERVNMRSDCFNRFPHEFSGGQRQRISIARSLSVNPRFIICDECVSALDVSVQAQVLNLLIELREEFHFTSIFISHDLSVVKFMSDRIMVMKEGKIEEIGDADEVYENPRSLYTKKLIEAIPKGHNVMFNRY